MGDNANDYYDWSKMSIVVTNKCDLTCKMCGIIRLAKHTLPEELALHCADFAERRGFEEIEIGGGEPTLVKYFWKLIDRLCEIDGPMIKLTTNAVRLTDDGIQKFASYPGLYVQVSIDGLSATHDRIREEKDGFKRSARSIQKLADARVTNLSINTVVMRSNFREMVDLYEYFKAIPKKFHAFSLLEDREFCPDEEIPREECDELIEILREVKRRADADGNDVILSDALLSSYRWRIMYPSYDTHPGRGCTVVKKGLIITHEGQVIPCWHYPWITDANVRSLHHHTLDEIVDAPDLRGELDRAVGPSGCRGCATMCYNWDPEFREKVMNPNGMAKARQLYIRNKESLRDNHPRVFAMAKMMRSTLSK